MTKQLHTIKTIASLNENVVAIWSSGTTQQHSITPDVLLPKGYVELLFVISGGYKRRILSSEHDQVIIDQSVVVGIQDKAVISQKMEELNAIGMLFDPMQFYLLFGDLGIMARNTTIPIVDSGNDGLNLLNKRVAKTTSISKALQEIENFFTHYIPQNVSCDSWQSTQKYLQNLRSKKGNGTSARSATLNKPNTNRLNNTIQKFTGCTLSEMREVLKTTGSFVELFANESRPFLSVKDLLRDIDETQEDNLF